MATITAHITWQPLAGSLGYTVEYKLKSSSTWITPTVPANPTLNTYYDIEVEEGLEYDGRISSACSTGGNKFRQFNILPPDPTPTLVWEEDTYQCTQAGGFVLDETFTGFSSPGSINWDEISNRFYVVDFDDVNGNFWYFDPNTITNYASVTHISGSNTDINTSVFDADNRRIIAAGDGSGGAKVLNIATNTITNLTYGTNVSPGTGNRAPIILSPTNIYAFCKTPDIIRIYDRTSLSFISEINKSSIPSASTYMPSLEGYHAVSIGSEIWLIASSRAEGKVARYDSAFTTLLGTITLPGVATAGGTFNNRYWMNYYYNETENRLFIGDLGSSQLFTIDTASLTIINTVQISNLRGKLYCDFSFSKNSLDNSVYMQATGVSVLFDSSANYRLYKINSTTGDIELVFPNAQASQLSLRLGTGEQWGVSSGAASWSGDPNWNTDGLVLKYI